jgi:hydroxymethylglutaryl-CoA synthase
MMTGIVACGAYVPLRRLGPGTRDWSPTAGRAVANWDEDSLTMAVAAALDCLGGADRAATASTTAPPATSTTP